MCQLFGVSAPKPIPLNDWLRPFFANSADNEHGWGVAAFDGASVNLEKEPRAAWQSEYLESRLKSPWEAACMIAHIRKASVGAMRYENCHPFLKRDFTGRTWTLAHNGTMYVAPQLGGYRTEQKGATDSERILLHMVRTIDMMHAQTVEERFHAAQKAIAEITNGNQVNLLFYDGELLYVHVNKIEKLWSLRFGDAVLFSTVPLSEDGWEPLPITQLLAFRNGNEVLRGEPHGNEYIGPEPGTSEPDYVI